METGSNKRSNVFLDIDRTGVKLNNQLHDVSLQRWWSTYNAQLDLLQEITGYIRGGDWETDEVKRKKCISVGKYGYEFTMQRYGVSRSALSKTVCRCEKKLLAKIGEDTVHLLASGDLAGAQSSFYAATCKDLKTLYPVGVVDLLPIANDDTQVLFNGDEVGQVIKFLRCYTLQGVQRWLSLLPEPQLRRLLWVLQCEDVEYQQAKVAVWKAITSNDRTSVERCIEVLEGL